MLVVMAVNLIEIIFLQLIIELKKLLFLHQVEYTEVDVKLANLTDDELSDDEIIQRTTLRLSPSMEVDDQPDEEEEEDDVPKGWQSCFASYHK